MKPTPAPLGLYLHIPFCRSKCVYCDFYSLPRSEDRMDAYAKDAEITLEANPDSAGDWKALRTLRKCGFNRISLGMQSADDTELAEIGRVHTMAQVSAAVEAARKAKFQNLSLDLIYGLPHQTLEGWQKTLSAAADLEPGRTPPACRETRPRRTCTCTPWSS